MTRVSGTYGPAFPTIRRLISAVFCRVLDQIASRRGYFRGKSRISHQLGERFRSKLNAGETVYLLGLGAGGHNSGVALVRCSKKHGIELISNHEEERFTGVKHETRFPNMALATLREQLAREGLTTNDLFACLGTWDYPAFAGMTFGEIFAEAPKSWAWLLPKLHKGFADSTPLYQALWNGPKDLARALGEQRPMPILGMRHHDCHAYYSYAVSPFAGGDQATLIAVIDGAGDSGAISIYEAKGTELHLRYDNHSFFDSLGHLFSIISATQGGWTPLSSEGRYMGAAAWGHYCRLTNPFYKQLRQILYFAKDGQVFLNRSLAQWHLKGLVAPYHKDLIEILGQPIATDKMWNPDAILDVDQVEHSEATRDRVDKAAALQLVYEDALFHLIGTWIQKTACHQLILSGGCALNCIANMRLLEHFNESYYQRYLHQPATRLHLWVPPNPGDAGATIGACYAFAMQNNAPLGPRLSHAFYCGEGVTQTELEAIILHNKTVSWIDLGTIRHSEQRTRIADLMAFLIAKNAVLGLFQGPGETGPRALGHRSILANPCHRKTLEILNAKVKYRERIRPLAPMATLEAALEHFELLPGGSDDSYAAYHFMTITAKARPIALKKVPAVVHYDGTSRVQIVSEDHDPFTYSFLKGMGKRVGVEIAVNTSLNVGSPIVQTASQAVAALQRAKGLDGMFFLSNCGQAWLAYDRSRSGEKDGGARLLQWIEEWDLEVPEGRSKSSLQNDYVVP